MELQHRRIERRTGRHIETDRQIEIHRQTNRPIQTDRQTDRDHPVNRAELAFELSGDRGAAGRWGGLSGLWVRVSLCVCVGLC